MAFRDFLYYSNSDRRSIVIIALIAVVLVGVLVVSAPKSGGDAAVEAEADSTEQTQPVALHEFDPNTVDSLSLIGFGLTPKQVQTFLRYRGAGAVFRTPESIAKVYGLSAEDVSRLQPYVRIAPEYAERSKPVYYERETVRQKSAANGSARGNGAEQKLNYPEKFDRLTKVDPNTADTALLQRIPGVGTWISRNIVEQRKRLPARLCQFVVFAWRPDGTLLPLVVEHTLFLQTAEQRIERAFDNYQVRLFQILYYI